MLAALFSVKLDSAMVPPLEGVVGSKASISSLVVVVMSAEERSAMPILELMGPGESNK